MKKLSIGKMAKLNNITVQTLRHYDKLGLLTPTCIDDESNYRYYHINQCARLDMIQYMKCLGMSLDSIKKHFDELNLDEFGAMLANQEKVIDEKIKQLTDMKDAVRHYSGNVKRYINAPKEGDIQLEHMNERSIFSYDAGINFYDNDMDTWEYMIRGLKNQATLRHLPMVKFCNVGSILRKSNVDNRVFYSTEIFIFVDKDEEKTEVLPAGNYLTLHFDDYYQEIDYGNQLLDYAHANGYEVIGDYICEVVIELPKFEEERNMFIKVQIPIKTS